MGNGMKKTVPEMDRNIQGREAWRERDLAQKALWLN
jgi:hypothetical protein